MQISHEMRVQQSAPVLLFVVLFLSATLTADCARAAEPSIDSIEVVVAEINKELASSSDIVAIQKSKAFARLRSTDDALLWTQLLLCDDRTAQAAGLLCVRDRRGDIAAISAARGILNTKSVTSPVIVVAEEILSKPLSPRDTADLASLMQFSSPSRLSESLLVACLGEENLLKVFEKCELSRCTADVVALFVEELSLLGKAKVDGPIKSKINDAIQMLRQVPGRPRCTYLSHTELSREEFIPLLASVLKDSAVDDPWIAILLIKRGQGYVEYLKSQLPELPESRRKLVQQYLDRQTKGKAPE